MDKKFYISLKAAKLLKEKGYNKETDCTIDYNGAIWFGEYRDECDFPCITKAEAIDWLDKKIKISIGYNDLSNKWHYTLTPVRTYVKEINNLSFSTRLEAEDAAIIDALEKI